jgi:hypothetical protein
MTDQYRTNFIIIKSDPKPQFIAISRLKAKTDSALPVLVPVLVCTSDFAS